MTKGRGQILGDRTLYLSFYTLLHYPPKSATDGMYSNISHQLCYIVLYHVVHCCGIVVFDEELCSEDF